ncbi:mitotic interactor and substrate of PLK1 isoform 1-T1 [Synchiropus picturatus]
MFRYTTPWQVLCHSLDPNFGRLRGGPRNVLTLQSFQTFRSTRQLPPPWPCPSLPPEGMDSSPRRWVIKPLSPQLQQSDLRTIITPSPDANEVFHFESASFNRSTSYGSDASGNVEIQNQHAIALQDGDNTSDEWPSISSSSSSSRSPSQSGFYSFVEDPTSPEAELNEAWMVSPQRQTQLAILKEDYAFKLQTYATNKKPESLFADDNESKYSLDLKNNTQAVGEEEERRLRMEIIRSQAPKKSYTEQKRLLEKSNLFTSTDKLIDGFSLTFSPVRAKTHTPQPAEPGAINEDQINFSTARQQFLKLEQERLKALTTPPRSSETYQKVSSQTKIGAKWRAETEGDVRKDASFKLENQPEVRWAVGLPGKSTSLEDLDSGLEELSLDAAGGYNSDDGVFSDKSETPIQREIRLALEREENLRLSRGLKHSSSVELVEIKTNWSKSPLPPNKIRDKSRVSFVFQNEIQKEKLRKEFDRNQPPLRHIEPDQVNKTEERKSDEILSPCCPHRHPEDSIMYTPHSLTASPVFRRTPPFSSSLTDSLTYHRENAAAQLWRESQETSGLQSRGLGAPDFIEKEIEESLKREQELRELRESRASREEILSSPTPLVEQANKIAVSQFYPTSKSVTSDKPSSCPSWSPHLSLRQPSVSLVTPQPWTSSSSLSPSTTALRPSISPVRGLTETLLLDYEERRQRMKLEEGSYAGIQPVDEVNNQVVESTRVIRHKNARALRWEAGVFANQETQ